MWKDTDDDNDRMKLGKGGEIVFGKHKYPPGGLRGYIYKLLSRIVGERR
jgi:hypothetical protein